ncbi:hypothetical protein ACFVJS_04025 [Nocardioides sp. NPDC057772]|uniref:hypothetical protein n=1 Tax=Nocardioides sp. NPDC057772 TaxID=3346245 RepID=UPI00366DF5DF
MPKPLFTYRIYCETCDRELTTVVPQVKVTIEEMRKDHAKWHERIEREAREKAEAAITAAEVQAVRERHGEVKAW